MGGHPDLLVIGGGVIGLTTAYYLAREGASVRVLDRSTPGSEASWAGAGIIPPGTPAAAATPYDLLRAISSAAFPAFSKELLDETGVDNGYRVSGGLEVFEEGHEPTTGPWQAEGIEYYPVCSPELQRLEPAVRLPTQRVYHLPGMAQVRNPWHLRALIAACTRRGVQIRPDSVVTEFAASSGKLTEARTESGAKHTAEHFLIASGAWSDRLLAPLGMAAGVHPVRGQMVLFHPPAPVLRRIVCADKRYLVPREDGRILVGSTEEPEAGFDKRTTAEGCAGLMRFATELVPALARTAIEKTWAGLRPGTRDGLPHLGRVPGYENAFVAAGHFRSGIQLSLATAQVITELLLDRRLSIPLEAFRLNRPATLPITPAFRS